MLDMYNKLPREIKLKKERFIINTDYRIFINFENDMQEESGKDVVINALQNFYPAFNVIIKKGLLEEAVDKFIWFYKLGKKDVEHKNKKGNNKQLFSYSYDFDLIYGAFKIYAHKDLRKYMHWWEFKSIWNSLPSECEFCKIKGYRAYDGKDKELLELKEAYKLPKTAKEIKDEIRRNKIYEALK